MDKAFVEKMKSSLLQLKQDIFNNLASENAEFQEIVGAMEGKDLVDIASDDIDMKTIEAIGAQEMKRLRLIDAALARIEMNHYGQCMKCSKKIPIARLEAIPYALMCIDCKSAEERRTR